MKQIWKKGIALLAVVLIIIFNVQIPVYAAANVSIAVSQSNLKIGDTVSVTVNISTDGAIGSYSMAVTYNPAVLEYTGGSGNGGGGTVTIAGYGDGSASRLSATLNFRAIGNGSSTIATSGGEVYGWDESTQSISHAGTTITVSAPQSSGNGNTGNAGGNGNEGPTDSPLVGSGDNTLKSLEISPGTLSPAFQPSVTSYSVQLPEDTTSIVVSAVPNDSKATVSVSHNNDLEPGANTTYIVVTAENGTQRTYTLHVQCGEGEETPEAPPITINGKEYTVASENEIEADQIPAGFVIGEETYEGVTIPAYISPNQLLRIVYLLDEEGTGQWFIYEKETGSFTLYVEVQASVNRYVFLEPKNDISIPAGFEAAEVEIQGQKIQGYINPNLPDFLLVYAMNLNGEQGFYLYDMAESTFQRYIIAEATTEEITTTEVTTTETVLVDDEMKVRNFRILLYVLSGVSIGLLCLNIGMFVYDKKRNRENHTTVEDYTDEDKE